MRQRERVHDVSPSWMGCLERRIHAGLSGGRGHLEAARFWRVSRAGKNGFAAQQLSGGRRMAGLEVAAKLSDMSRMDKAAVIRKLRAHEAELRAEGISHVFLFGSVARGEADERSDVDLFYDYDPDRFGFLQFMRLRELAPAIVGRAVHIMPRDGIHPLVRSEVEQAAIEVF
jgi:predicted nucleotidyltransferase